RGQDIYGVVIPYQHIRRFNLDDCFLFNGLPTWEAIKNSSDLKSKLRDKDIRRKIEQERIACQGKLEFPEWHGWDRVVFEHLEKPELKKLRGLRRKLRWTLSSTPGSRTTSIPRSATTALPTLIPSFWRK